MGEVLGMQVQEASTPAVREGAPIPSSDIAGKTSRAEGRVELLKPARTRRRPGATPHPEPPRLVPKPDGADEFLSPAQALIDGADVASSPRDSARRRLLALADVTGILLAYAGVWLIAPPTSGTLADRAPLAGGLLLLVLLNKVLGLYDRDDKLIHKSTLDELPKLLHSITMGALLVFMAGPLVVPVEIGREQTVVFWLLGVVSVPVCRAIARWWVHRSFAPERCLILGSGAVAQIIARKLAAHPENGVELVGFVDESRGARRRGMGDVPMLGDVADIAEICREHGIERVLIAFSSAGNDQLLDVIRAAKRARIKITIVPRLFEVIGHQVIVDEVEGMTMLSLRGLSRSKSSLMLKRAIDLTGALLGLVLLSPLMVVVAIAIKATSRGPVLYKQRRIGRDRQFAMYKFRTMVVGADQLKSELRHLNEADGPMFKIASDPRLTRVGSFLRRTSIDELPQLWNVIRGEMSLVGPRPLVPDEDDHVIGWHRTRLDLTPGLTGPWQVAGRTAVPFQEMVKMDYLYVAEWSLWNDIRLLLRTAPVVVRARGH